MTFQTITKESLLRVKLTQIKIKQKELEKEFNEANWELTKEIEKNKNRRPSRFL